MLSYSKEINLHFQICQKRILESNFSGIQVITTPLNKNFYSFFSQFETSTACAFQTNKKAEREASVRQTVALNLQKFTYQNYNEEDGGLVIIISTLSLIIGSSNRAGCLWAECSRPFPFSQKFFWTRWSTIVDSYSGRFEFICAWRVSRQPRWARLIRSLSSPTSFLFGNFVSFVHNCIVKCCIFILVTFF